MNYDHFTSEKGHEVIANGWKSAGITGAVGGGLSNLASSDPFVAIDPLECSSMLPLIENKNINQFAIPSFVTYSDDCDDDDEDEWYIDGSTIRNIFEIVDDDTDI